MKALYFNMTCIHFAIVIETLVNIQFENMLGRRCVVVESAFVEGLGV